MPETITITMGVCKADQSARLKQVLEHATPEIMRSVADSIVLEFRGDDKLTAAARATVLSSIQEAMRTIGTERVVEMGNDIMKACENARDKLIADFEEHMARSMKSMTIAAVSHMEEVCAAHVQTKMHAAIDEVERNLTPAKGS